MAECLQAPGGHSPESPGRWLAFLLACGIAGLAGCSSVSVQTQPYAGVPSFPPVDAAKVQVLTVEPDRPKERLGEIVLYVDGEPSRTMLEHRLQQAGARMGADAVFLVVDQTRLFPVVYVDYWGATYSAGSQRRIVAVAIKYK